MSDDDAWVRVYVRVAMMMVLITRTPENLFSFHFLCPFKDRIFYFPSGIPSAPRTRSAGRTLRDPVCLALYTLSAKE